MSNFFIYLIFVKMSISDLYFSKRLLRKRLKELLLEYFAKGKIDEQIVLRAGLDYIVNDLETLFLRLKRLTTHNYAVHFPIYDKFVQEINRKD